MEETYTHLNVWETLEYLKKDILTSDLVRFETDWSHDFIVRITAISKSGAFQERTQELLEVYEKIMRDVLYPYEDEEGPKSFNERIATALVGGNQSRREELTFNLRDRFPTTEKEIVCYIPVVIVSSKDNWLTLKCIRNLSEICVDSDRSDNPYLLTEILTSISSGLIDPEKEYRTLLEIVDIRKEEV